MISGNGFEIIDLYFDGELDKNSEVKLFDLLSRNENARDYFRNLNAMRDSVRKSTVEFPDELEERIFHSISRATESKKHIREAKSYFHIISYAAAAILLFISGYLFMKVNNYQERLETISNQLFIQSRTIDMLYNSYDDIVVRANSENQIVIKPNIWG